MRSSLSADTRDSYRQPLEKRMEEEKASNASTNSGVAKVTGKAQLRRERKNNNGEVGTR